MLDHSPAKPPSPSRTGHKPKLVAVNDAGLPIGEDHPRAHLTDQQVDQIRELREGRRLSIPVLARRFKVSVSTIHAIVTYRSRAQRPAAWKRLGEKSSRSA
jgi:hypothetical protein